MAVEIQEQGTETGSSKYDLHSNRELTYRIKGSDDKAEHWAALQAELPSFIVDAFSGVTLLLSELTFSRIGYQLWDYRCVFNDRAMVDQMRQLETGSYRMHFATTGGTARITNSLETVRGYNNSAASESAGGFASTTFVANKVPDYRQAIGVTGENDVQGLDIVVPALKFSIEYRQPGAVITDPYIRTLEAMTGMVNDATFFGRAAGEVLFMGSNGSQATDNDPTISYEFIRMPNMTNQRIGDILNIAKKGHEYLWCLFKEREQNGEYVPKVPVAVYVERIYDLANFANLGIGT